jgi:hypothetical protein
MRICSVDGCDERHEARGLCRVHYAKMIFMESKIKPIDWVSTKDRFEKFADIKETTKCIEWTGYYGTTGYGVLMVNRMPKKTHRLSYQIYNGKIPEGMWVLHKCDNSRCVNPKHLYIGDSKRNVHDMLERNRHVSPLGEKNGKSKLTNDQVREIKIILKKSNKIRETARKFNVSRYAIQDIKSGKTWSHIKI